MAKVYIAFGSNKGDRAGYIAGALKEMQSRVLITRISSVFESPPAEGVKGGSFFNGAIEVKTGLSPQKLFEFLQAVEIKTGRAIPHLKGEEREVDLDIIFYGNSIIKSQDLTVPHPKYSRRDFVIIPLSEIAPDFRDPETGEKMIALKNKIRGCRK